MQVRRYAAMARRRLAPIEAESAKIEAKSATIGAKSAKIEAKAATIGAVVGNKKRRGPYQVPTPPGYRTSGGVGWLAGARFSKPFFKRSRRLKLKSILPKIPCPRAYAL
jgi:hypothetical protein